MGKIALRYTISIADVIGHNRMKIQHFHQASLWMATVLTCAFLQQAHADFDLAGPDGRTIHLKDDGTWRYAEPVGDGENAEKPKLEGEAILTLLSKTESGNTCRYALQLVNNLPYEIRTIVPSFVAYRDNGVVFGRQLTNFNTLPPGNLQKRSILFEGIRCRDIVRLQVTGGDRCTMGEFDKYNASGGVCLARIKVVESDIVPFEK